MVIKNKRIDDYISKAQPFAQPILKKLRVLVHKACPDATETIKWGMPSFEYEGPMFGFAAFKKHCTAGFWKHALLKDPKGYLGERSAQGGEAMGNLGRITSLKDLPPEKAILDFIRQAARLNADGVKVQRKPSSEKKDLVIPGYFSTALKKNKLAADTFKNFSYSNKKEYVQWVTDAKTEETRTKRLATTVAWLAEGKIRNWKYVKK